MLKLIQELFLCFGWCTFPVSSLQAWNNLSISVHTWVITVQRELTTYENRWSFDWDLVNLHVPGEPKNPPYDFCWYYSNAWEFLYEILHDCKAIKYTLYHQVLLKYFWNWQSYTVLTTTTPILLADGKLPLHQQERVAAELARPEPARLPRLGCDAGEVPQAKAEAKDHRQAEGGASDHLARAATGADRQGCGKLHQALDCLCGCQWWALWTCPVTLSSCTSASSSDHQPTGFCQSHQQTGSFQSHPRTSGEDNIASNV